MRILAYSASSAVSIDLILRFNCFFGFPMAEKKHIAAMCLSYFFVPRYFCYGLEIFAPLQCVFFPKPRSLKSKLACWFTTLLEEILITLLVTRQRTKSEKSRIESVYFIAVNFFGYRFNNLAQNVPKDNILQRFFLFQ